jgi:phage baseplate assembly protein W
MAGIDFLGKGPAYPFEKSTGGNWKMAEKSELVGMGVEQAILTGIGKRPMQKRKGNMMVRFLFSMKDNIRDNVATEYCRKALIDMEPRVKLIGVTVEDGDDADVSCSVDYQVINEKSSANKVIRIWKEN